MKKEAEYSMSIRTYYGSDYTTHKRVMKLSEIKKWIEAYRFTHPEFTSITIKIWMEDTKE